MGVWVRNTQRGPEAEPVVIRSKTQSLFAFENPTEAANLPQFLSFANLVMQRTFAKIFPQ